MLKAKISKLPSSLTVNPTELQDLKHYANGLDFQLSACGYIRIKRTILVSVTEKYQEVIFNNFELIFNIFDFLDCWIRNHLHCSPRKFQRNISASNELNHPSVNCKFRRINFRQTKLVGFENLRNISK